MLSPAPATVTAEGPLHIQSPGRAAQCHGNFRVEVDAAGQGAVTMAQTGNIDPNCPITALNLPWRVRITGAATATAHGVAWTSPYFGLCGPINVPLKISAKGVWRVGRPTAPGKCAFTGQLTTSPRETIIGRAGGD
jgi:hypothetical protein